MLEASVGERLGKLRKPNEAKPLNPLPRARGKGQRCQPNTLSVQSDAGHLGLSTIFLSMSDSKYPG